MDSSRFFWIAVLLSLAALFLIVTGGAVTSLHDQSGRAAFEQLHQAGAWATGIIGVIFLAWVAFSGKGRGVLIFAVITAVVGAAESYLGTAKVLGTSQAIATVHAWIAAMFFGAVGALVWFVSPAFARPSDFAKDYGWPSLRSLSMLSAILVAAQIEMGAAYRHNMLSVLPHLLGAPVVALIVLTAAAFALRQFPGHPTLRPLALGVLIITSVQVALGMTTLIFGLLQTAMTPAALAIRMAHVGTGSLTMAITLILAIEIRRKVLPKES
jgi:cytochrome c oxidase assembly protein subunit 15